MLKKAEAHEETITERLQDLADRMPGTAAERAQIANGDDFTEIRAIQQMARHNPSAWAALLRLLARQSRTFADQVGNIGPKMTPEAAFGQVQYFTGQANSLAWMARELMLDRLEKRLDGLVESRDNGKVHSPNDKPQPELPGRPGVRWISAVG